MVDGWLVFVKFKDRSEPIKRKTEQKESKKECEEKDEKEQKEKEIETDRKAPDWQRKMKTGVRIYQTGRVNVSQNVKITPHIESAGSSLPSLRPAQCQALV